MKHINTILIISLVFLIVLNGFSVAFYGGIDSRFAQLISSSCLLLLLLFTKPKEVFVTIPFFLFVISDILMLQYDLPGFRKFTSSISILAYICLIQLISPYVRNIKNVATQWLMLFGIVVINLIMLYLLIDMVQGNLNDFILIYLFYIYGFAMIILVVLAFSYNNRYSNWASFFFVSAVMALVLGEISSFIAFYVDVPIFFYPERIFYLLGLFGLIKFSIASKKEGILMNEDFF